MTYMFILKCALKLVEEIILYYDARSKKHQNIVSCFSNFNIASSQQNDNLLLLLLLLFYDT